ncbi:MAG TPA: GFA family protein, partial [Acidocella sp.]|nr:GFA family protein [Acidocella sp.]
MHLTGACLCGTIKYEILKHASDVVDYCHCRQCQRASGAPVLAWLQVAPERFKLTHGLAKSFASSAHATRWFCPDCGAQLYMTDSLGASVGVTLGTLDMPDLVRPTVHGWESERLGWFYIADDLPRYPQAP